MLLAYRLEQMVQGLHQLTQVSVPDPRDASRDRVLLEWKWKVTAHHSPIFWGAIKADGRARSARLVPDKRPRVGADFGVGHASETPSRTRSLNCARYEFEYMSVEARWGSEGLTQQVRTRGASTLDSIIAINRHDLTIRIEANRAKTSISQLLPLMTHSSPRCRVFSSANHRVIEEGEYQRDMTLAIHWCKIAQHAASLNLDT